MGGLATIPAGSPFVDRLAERLLTRHGPAGDGRLADVLVLLPTRRAVRSLTEAFLRASEGRALLLPLMRPLGDLAEDEPPLAMLDPADEFDLPPPIPEMERRLLLARLVLRGPIQVAGPAEALALADALAALIDEVHTERLDFARLPGLVTEERFQEHWRKILAFLDIVAQHWPRILAERGMIDPAARRDLLMRRLAERWRAGEAAHPVYIAGSTGSVPGTADLMAAVLTLAEGHVVLPGFDPELDEVERMAVLDEPGQPQHGMQQLLRRLRRSPADVAVWGKPGALPRRRLLHEVLRPAGTTERWCDLAGLDPAALEGLRVIEAESPRQEATAIALVLREAMEIPGRTAQLVTPDRTLARRVAAELGRFDAVVDDSGGTPLRLTAVGAFLQLAAEALAGGFAPVALLALLKHPLAAGGMAPAELRRAVRRIELRRLRGLRRYSTLVELQAQVAAMDDGGDAASWLGELIAAAKPFAALADAGEHGLTDWLAAFVGFVEWLATTDETPGAALVWRGDAGELAAGLLAEAADAADAPPVTAGDWPALLDRLIGGASVRPSHGAHPRLRILGPLEARLQTADLVVLGGLNEGVWPARADVDPWLSRPMRADFGLPQPERRIGLQAHDFMQLAAGPEVMLTRATKAEGTPTVPSRWLLRLRSVVRGAGLSFPAETLPLAWAELLDHSPEVRPVAPPAPRPPAEARPRRLSVTAIERLIRDPYEIYAGRVLGLRKLDPLDEEAGPRHKGEVIHGAFEDLVNRHPGAWNPTLWLELEELGRRRFADFAGAAATRALWWRRFEKAARWLLAHEAGRAVARRFAEYEGQHPAFAELPGFVLSAKADRIDVLADGGLVIVDYKTGHPPSPKQIEAGFAVQMPLQALIAAAGGFESIGAAKVSELVHVRVHGVALGGEWKPVKSDLDQLLEDTRKGLIALISAFLDPDTPYLSRPRVQFLAYEGDFDHLARVREWSVAGEAEAEA